MKFPNVRDWILACEIILVTERHFLNKSWSRDHQSGLFCELHVIYPDIGDDQTGIRFHTSAFNLAAHTEQKLAQI